MEQRVSNDQRLLSVYRFVMNAAWPFRWYIFAQLIIHCLWAIYVSFSSYLTKRIIDVVNQNSLVTVVHAVAPYALAYFAALAFIILMNRLYNWLSLRTNPLIEQRSLSLLSAQLVSHSYRFYQEQFAGSLANNVRTISAGTPKIVELATERIFRPLLTVVIALWTVAQVNYLFMLVFLVWLLLFISGVLYAAPHLRELAALTAFRSSRVVGQLVDMITNILSVRLFTAKKSELHRVQKLSDAVVQAEQSRLWFFLKLQLFQGILFIAFIGISLWLLIKGYVQGWVTAGDFALILLLNESINHLLWRMAQDLASLYEQVGLVGHGLRTIMSPVQLQDRPDAKPLVVTNGKIAFEHVTFRYNEHDLFVDLSVTIEPKQKVGLVGYSGSGKSTFVNLILRLFDIQEGRIMIDDQNISYLTQDSLRRAISFIPQNPTMFHRTVYENIAYARPDATYEEVVAAAKMAHADEFITTLAHGYETEVGEGGSRLSGGQRQRIAIARAFLKNARILILDEITSQLDTATESYIQESLSTLMQGKTTLVIAHRLSTLLHMNRILVFDKGVIVQDGTHEQLIAQQGLYKMLWDHQVGGFLLDQDDDQK